MVTPSTRVAALVAVPGAIPDAATVCASLWIPVASTRYILASREPCPVAECAGVGRADAVQASWQGRREGCLEGPGPTAPPGLSSHKRTPHGQGMADETTFAKILQAEAPIGTLLWTYGRSGRTLRRQLLLSGEVVELLKALLTKGPAARCTVAAAKQNAWFGAGAFDWGGTWQRTPPLVPKKQSTGRMQRNSMVMRLKLPSIEGWDEAMESLGGNSVRPRRRASFPPLLRALWIAGVEPRAHHVAKPGPQRERRRGAANHRNCRRQEHHGACGPCVCGNPHKPPQSVAQGCSCGLSRTVPRSDGTVSVESAAFDAGVTDMSRMPPLTVEMDKVCIRVYREGG